MTPSMPSHSNVIESDPDRSIFRSALYRYCYAKPDDRTKPHKVFIDKCCTMIAEKTPTAADVNALIEQTERQSDRSRKPITRVLKRVIGALEGIDNIVSALASADPMPSSIIWAALSFVVKGAHSYIDLCETIRSQLSDLDGELHRMVDYEDLYGHSETMRGLLCESYISVLRFWSTVQKRCNENFLKGAVKSALTQNKDLDEIISDIKKNSDAIEKSAHLAEAKLQRSEREKGEAERAEGRVEREAASRHREDQRYRSVCEWLGSQKGSGNNTDHHDKNVTDRAGGTCEWLLENPDYKSWKTPPHDSVSAPILWVYGPPGSGKTFLCSRAINDIQKTYHTAAVVYHFFQFDKKTNDTLATLKILAYALFEIYWKCNNQVAEEFFQMTQQTSSIEQIKGVIRLLVESLKSWEVFFFLDGLDEEVESGDTWNDARAVLDFIIQLVAIHAGIIRLWCSSQDHPFIREVIPQDSSSFLDVKEYVNEDVKVYLTKKMDFGKLGIPFEQAEDLMMKLVRRTEDEGNFLWAHFMISELLEAEDLATIMDLIAKSHPARIDESIQRIFNRIAGDHRPLACQVFALIRFARRPLRIKEIQEAVGVLKDPTNPEKNQPFPVILMRIFASLVNVQGGKNTSGDDRTCRLYHSTIQTYLDRHPDPFQCGISGDHTNSMSRTNHPLVTPNIMADACLSYLSQGCFAELFQNTENGWQIRSGNSSVSIDNHRFLIYSAKYWYRHLDDLKALDSADIWKQRIKDFMMSSNFRTCIQVQSLWVDSQFEAYWSHGTVYVLRRVLPRWFKSEDETFKSLLRSYGLLLRDWRAFLSHARCNDPGYALLSYAGQVDRCWWAALGPDNYLSKLQGRYISFVFRAEYDTTMSWEVDNVCESICASGNKLNILRLQSHDQNSQTLTFLCEHWTLDGVSLPKLTKRQTIKTDERTTLWPTYAHHAKKESHIMRIGRAPLAAFNSDCSSLRLGAQIFILGKDGDFVPLGNRQTDALLPLSYFEEWAIRGDYVVLATRRRVATRSVNKAASDVGKSERKCRNEMCGDGDNGAAAEEKDTIDYDQGLTSDASSEDDSDDSDEAYESWSECSTEHSDDALFEDDISTPWACPESESDSNSDSSDSESSGSSSDEGLPKSTMEAAGATECDSDSDDSAYVPSYAVVGYGQPCSDDEDCDWEKRYMKHARGVDTSDENSDEENSDEENSDEENSDEENSDEEPIHRSASRRVLPAGMDASITVFDTRPHAKPKVFHFSQKIRHILYDSPPVIHPTSSLIVWPLSCGDVLFADFVGNTYFSRRLRPSTSYTRQIFMKCHFSLCGQYLHVACLEGRHKPERRKKVKPLLKLALMVLTYRLCGKQTSRSPPALIHRVKVALDSERSLSVSNFPYTLTWMPSDLYFTCSKTPLKVYRIALFNPNKGISEGNAPSAVVLKEPIILPETVKERKVHFFPSNSDCSPSRIIIGSKTNSEDMWDIIRQQIVEVVYDGFTGDTPSPPIGCYVNKSDLGEWVESTDRSTIPDDLGIGRFDRLKEKFNPEDDCDLEPYLF